MAQYKVLQDIEAEDKLLGPLSLRQFIYAILVFVFGFVAFRLAIVRWYLAFPFLPPMLFFGLLAAPFGKDQPSEVWLLAKISFFFKSRRRIWDQSGMKELVTITAPKKIERVLTKGFSNQEVKSRLNALSATLDSRGWAVKNVDISTFQRPTFNTSSSGDRLVDISSIPQNNVAVDPASDILDPQNNPLASKVNQSLQQSTQDHRQALLQKVRTLADAENKKIQARAPAPAAPQVPPNMTPDQTIEAFAKLQNYNQPNYTAVRTDLAPVIIDDEPEEELDLSKLDPPQVSQPQTSSQDDAQSITISHNQTAVTPAPDPAILENVKNDDVSVETLGRQAARQKQNDSSDGEVVISLR